MVGFPAQGEFGDFIDAGAGQSALQKYAPSRIQDASIDLSGQLPRGFTDAAGATAA